ncbi:aminodeoxychorismate lyase [Entomohabitans teleogrylli]|uniref:aminodeoxychorismate lyase n=1 Tax=Entomohabitans teleogrylli TaxID=1384589 RepID=UPI00073D8B42|nr:aminodeoxychorismate lyase [Entomohabitans teleogrylli]
MYLINGHWQQQLPAGDRAIQFGDGCFTTARVVAGEVRFLEQHLQRLRQGCRQLLMAEPDVSQIGAEMRLLARQQADGVIKVIITRGSGGRGYSAANCSQPTRILCVSDAPQHYLAWRQQGVALALSPVRLGCNPALAGIKHLNRLEQVLIRTHLDQTGGEEALVLDSDGMLVECCAANLFWRKGNRVYTPSVDRAGVNGIMRQHIVALLATSPWSVSEVREPVQTLEEADEVLACNALMPVLPVRQTETRHYSSRELWRWLAPQCE